MADSQQRVAHGEARINDGMKHRPNTLFMAPRCCGSHDLPDASLQVFASNINKKSI
jgi:hypothetical protein